MGIFEHVTEFICDPNVCIILRLIYSASDGGISWKTKLFKVKIIKELFEVKND